MEAEVRSREELLLGEAGKEVLRGVWEGEVP